MPTESKPADPVEVMTITVADELVETVLEQWFATRSISLEPGDPSFEEARTHMTEALSGALEEHRLLLVARPADEGDLREGIARAVFGVVSNAAPGTFHPAYERDDDLWLSAADAILDLVHAHLAAVEQERDRLREALKPFAMVAESYPFQPGTSPMRERHKQQAIVWSYHDSVTDTDYRLYIDDFRRARAALAAGDEGAGK